MADALDAHITAPQHMGRMTEADGVGTIGSIAVGRALRVFLRLDGPRIAAMRYQVYACQEMVPSASALACLVPGMTVKEALVLDEVALAKRLDIDRLRLPATVWALEGLRAAAADAGGPSWHLYSDEEHGELLCRCHGVTRATIDRVLAAGASTVEDLVAATTAGGGCGSCRRELAALVAEPPPVIPRSARGGTGRIGLLKRIAAVSEVLLDEWRADGNAVEIWDLQAGRLLLRSQGAWCNDSVAVTQAASRLERLLRDEVDPTLTVVIAAD